MNTAPPATQSAASAAPADPPLSDQDRTRRNRSLAISVLASPILWGLQIAIGYGLVPRACEARSTVSLGILAALMGILTIAAGVIAWQQWRIGASDRLAALDSPETDRSFLGSLGLIASLLFFFIILATGIANVLLSPCPLLTMTVP